MKRNTSKEASTSSKELRADDRAQRGSTPTPWEVVNADDNIYGDADIKGFDGSFVIESGHDNGVSRANAESIVRAVNSHEALLAAAKKVVKCGYNGGDIRMATAHGHLKDIIAQAEGDKTK